VDNKQTNGMVSAAANYSQSDSQSTSKTAATLQSGGAITVRSGGDMNLEGSKFASKGDTTLAAGGQLTISAARYPASSQKIGAGLVLVAVVAAAPTRARKPRKLGQCRAVGRVWPKPEGQRQRGHAIQRWQAQAVGRAGHQAGRHGAEGR
jgi:hypothetical protein